MHLTNVKWPRIKVWCFAVHKFNTATHVAAVYVVASNKEASRRTVSALNDDIYPA